MNLTPNRVEAVKAGNRRLERIGIEIAHDAGFARCSCLRSVRAIFSANTDERKTREYHHRYFYGRSRRPTQQSFLLSRSPYFQKVDPFAKIGFDPVTEHQSDRVNTPNLSKRRSSDQSQVKVAFGANASSTTQAQRKPNHIDFVLYDNRIHKAVQSLAVDVPKQEPCHAILLRGSLND